MYIDDRETGATKGRPRRPATIQHYRNIFDHRRWSDSGIADMSAASLTHDVLDANILEPLRKEGKHVAARRHFAAVKAVYAWACGKPSLRISTNPLHGIKNGGTETPRDRWLSEDELAVLWCASETAGHVRPMLRLLALTGQRPGDIEGLRWSEVRDLDGNEPTIVISKSRYKTGKEHVVPLTPAVVEILKDLRKTRDPSSELVFSTNGKSPSQIGSKAKRKIDAAIDTTKQEMVAAGALSQERADRAFAASWHPHDLRRSVRSYLGKLGVPDPVARAVTGHKPPAKMDATYMHYDYREEARDALTAWATYLQSVVSAKTQTARDAVERKTRDAVRERMRMILGLSPMKAPKASKPRRRARKAA
jgi:integrase